MSSLNRIQSAEKTPFFQEAAGEAPLLQENFSGIPATVLCAVLERIQSGRGGVTPPVLIVETNNAQSPLSLDGIQLLLKKH